MGSESFIGSVLSIKGSLRAAPTQFNDLGRQIKDGITRPYVITTFPSSHAQERTHTILHYLGKMQADTQVRRYMYAITPSSVAIVPPPVQPSHKSLGFIDNPSFFNRD